MSYWMMSNVLSSSGTKRLLCKVFRTMKISKVSQFLTDGLNASEDGIWATTTTTK
jgi:hypothetical protein